MKIYFLRNGQLFGTPIDHENFFAWRWSISCLWRLRTIIWISINLSPISWLEHSLAWIDAPAEISGRATMSTSAWGWYEVNIRRLRNLFQLISRWHGFQALLTTLKLAYTILVFIFLTYKLDRTLIPLIHYLFILVWKYKVARIIFFIRLLVDSDGSRRLGFIHFLACLFNIYWNFSFVAIYLLWPGFFISLKLFEIKSWQPTICKWLKTFQVIIKRISWMCKWRFLFVRSCNRLLPANRSSQSVHIVLGFVRDFHCFII